MNPLRLGIVGAGRIAGSYVKALEGCSEVVVAGVADTNSEAGKLLAEQVDCVSYDSHAELQDRVKPEAVLICTPPNTHFEIATFFLEQRVHVMCEKPLAVDVNEARLMLDSAASSGAVLTMASKFRFVEDVARARSIIESGILGELILIENTFASRVDMAHRWNSDPTVAGGGVLIDNGTHSVDLTRYFLGPIAEVMAVEGRRVQDLGVEDTAQLFLRNHDSVRATIDLSWSLDKERDGYLDIYGSDGTILLGWTRSRYRQSSAVDWVDFGEGYSKERARRNQLVNFTKSIRNGEGLVITAEDALASVEVIRAAYQSLSRDDWVRVESAPTLSGS